MSTYRNTQRATERLATFLREHPWSTKEQIMDALGWTWSQASDSLSALRVRVDSLGTALTLVTDHRGPGAARYGLTDDQEVIAENVIFEGRYLWTRTYNGVDRLAEFAAEAGRTVQARRLRRVAVKAADEIEMLTRELAESHGYEPEVIDAWFVRTRELAEV